MQSEDEAMAKEGRTGRGELCTHDDLEGRAHLKANVARQNFVGSLRRTMLGR